MYTLSYNTLACSYLRLDNYSNLGLKTFVPIGISFYALQGIGYVIDIYKGKVLPEKRLSNYLLFMSFFPQVLAGPIERIQDIMPQFRKGISFNVENIIKGVKRIIWGLFCKLIIADKIGIIADQFLLDINAISSTEILFAITIFSFQIYYDFSGYTNIALGIAKLFGISLKQNFKWPYLATSFRSFWHRWHISLSTWFRDYLYIQLGGNKVSSLRWVFIIFFVFIVSGIWHGIGVAFIFWGLLHGLFLIIERLFPYSFTFSTTNKFVRILKIFFVFSLVTISWIPFRINNLNELEIAINQLFIFRNYLEFSFNDISISNIELIYYLALLVFCIIIDHTQFIERWIEKKLTSTILVAELVMTNFMLLNLIALGDLGNKSFIYFQF